MLFFLSFFIKIGSFFQNFEQCFLCFHQSRSIRQYFSHTSGSNVKPTTETKNNNGNGGQQKKTTAHPYLSHDLHPSPKWCVRKTFSTYFVPLSQWKVTLKSMCGSQMQFKFYLFIVSLKKLKVDEISADFALSSCWIVCLNKKMPHSVLYLFPSWPPNQLVNVLGYRFFIQHGLVQWYFLHASLKAGFH